MGYFNFLYKLTRILSNKRFLKVFAILLVVSILYITLIKPTYAVSPYDEEYTDPYNAFTINYGAIQREFIMRLNRGYANGTIGSNYFKNFIDRMTSGDYIWYFIYGSSAGGYNNGSPQNFDYMTAYCLPVNHLNAVQQNYDWFGISGISQYLVTLDNNNSSWYRYQFNRHYFATITETTLNLYCPWMYLNYIDPFVVQYCSSVVKDGEINDTLVQILNMTTSINSHAEGTEENTEEIKDFLSNPNANDSSFNRTPITAPSDNVSDSINSVFYMYQEAFRC